MGGWVGGGCLYAAGCGVGVGLDPTAGYQLVLVLGATYIPGKRPPNLSLLGMSVWLGGGGG